MKRLSLLMAIAAIALTPLAVHAQMRPTALDFIPPTYVEQLINSFWGIMVTVIVGVLGSAGAWLSYRLNRFFNIQDVEKQKQTERMIRDLLHDAVFSGVKYASTQLGYTIDLNGPPPKEWTDMVVGYVRSKSPDTAIAAKASDEDLKEIAISKLPDLKSLVEKAFNDITVKVPVLTKPVQPAKPPATKPPAARSKGK